MRAWARSSLTADLLAVARSSLRPGSVEFACHAAVPVALDPGFVHLLRVNFFLDPPHVLPYEAEAEFLLSPLVRELGEGLYEVRPELRQDLLEGLVARFGTARLTRVAVLLEQYTDRTAAWQEQPELEHAQLLTALSLVDPAAASAWLASAEAAGGASVELGREWFIAMRHKLSEGSPGQDVDAALAALSTPDGADAAVHRLGELAMLPGSDLVRISRALADHPSPNAQAVLDAIVALVPAPRINAGAAEAPPAGVLARLPSLIGLLTNSDAKSRVPIGIHDDGTELTVGVRDGNYSVTGDAQGCRELLRTIVLGLSVLDSSANLQFMLIDLCADPVFDGFERLPHVSDVVRFPAQDLTGLEELRRAVRLELDARRGYGQAGPWLYFVLAADGPMEELARLELHLFDAGLTTRSSAIVCHVRGEPTIPSLANLTLSVSKQPYPWHAWRTSSGKAEGPFAVVTTSRPVTSASEWDRVLGRASQTVTEADSIIKVAQRGHVAEPILLPPITSPPTLGDVLNQYGPFPDEEMLDNDLTPVGWVVRRFERKRRPMLIDLREGLVISGTPAATDDFLYTVVMALAMTRPRQEINVLWAVYGHPRMTHLEDLPNVSRILLPEIHPNFVTEHLRIVYGSTSAALRLIIPDGWDPSPVLSDLQQDGFQVLVVNPPHPSDLGSIPVLDIDAGLSADGRKFVPARPALQEGETLEETVDRIRRWVSSPARGPRQGSTPLIEGFTDLTLLNEHAFTAIYRATQDSDGREVAVRIGGSVLENEVIRAQFIARPWMKTRSIRHPNLVELLDMGITHDGRPYLVMELCMGSYEDLIPISHSEVVNIGIMIADAVAAVHDDGMVHGKINPSSILISQSGEPRLMPTALHPAGETEATAEDDVFDLCETLYTLVQGPLPEPLAAVLTAGLQEDPQSRPTARQLGDMLAGLDLGTETPAEEAKPTEGRGPFRGGD